MFNLTICLFFQAAGHRMTVPVAIVPCGSSNGVSMALYGTTDPVKVVEKILLQCEVGD